MIHEFVSIGEQVPFGPIDENCPQDISRIINIFLEDSRGNNSIAPPKTILFLFSFRAVYNEGSKIVESKLF